MRRRIVLRAMECNTPVTETCGYSRGVIQVAPGSDFPDWLRARMAEKNWSAAELARKARVGQSSISGYQLGTRPTMESVLKIAKAVGIAPAEALEAAGFEPGDASREADPIIPEIRLIVEEFSPAEQGRLIAGIQVV